MEAYTFMLHTTVVAAQEAVSVEKKWQIWKQLGELLG